jgi:hypothetical protein
VGCRLPVVCRGGRRIGCSAAASQQGGDGFRPYISLSSGPWTHLRIRASNDATDHALPAATCAASSPPPALTRVSKTETGSYARRRRALLCSALLLRRRARLAARQPVALPLCMSSPRDHCVARGAIDRPPRVRKSEITGTKLQTNQ